MRRRRKLNWWGPMAKYSDLYDGTTVAFPDHLTDEEIAERVRCHAELAAIGVSRSPNALPMRVAPSLPVAAPAHARSDWEFPTPRREPTWGESYVQRRAASQREAHDRVYGRHRGRRS